MPCTTCTARASFIATSVPQTSCSNISPDRSILAKVSDFGSANMAKQSKTVGAGAVLYSAPEMFTPASRPLRNKPQKWMSTATGSCLLEVTSRKMPTQDDPSRRHVAGAERHSIPDIHKLIVQCTEHSPANRPTMADILNRLC